MSLTTVSLTSSNGFQTRQNNHNQVL